MSKSNDALPAAFDKPRYQIEMVPLSIIKPNPNNPRWIKDRPFQLLVKSIKDFPEMMHIRPIVLNDVDMTLGGNRRYDACVINEMDLVPVIYARGLTEAQQAEFIIKDNVQAGEWDDDVLANVFDINKLHEWGLTELPLPPDTTSTEPEGNPDEKPVVIKVTFKSATQMMEAESEIRAIIDRFPGSYFSIAASSAE